MRTIRATRPWAAGIAVVLAAPLYADDWSNSGGNAGRNGRTAETGPVAPDVLWAGGRSSIIAWQPVIEGQRVFIVRQTGMVPAAAPADSPVVALDLATGQELWAEHLPYEPGDWTAWIAGVRDGRVFASRSGNGGSAATTLHALDAATGAPIWASEARIDAGPYDGVVFAEDGDPIIGGFSDLWRINAEDGATVWRSPRLCAVSNSCGAARAGKAVYIADASPTGNVVKRFNVQSGAFEYAGPVMPGFTVQNTPVVAPDGTIYLSRTQNNPALDFFYAFTDSAGQITQKWSTPARWTTASEFAVGHDGSVYMMAPGDVVRRLHPQTGQAINSSEPVITDSHMQVRMAIDAQGRLFLSNGSFANGRLYCFNADLTVRWSVPVPSINIGGPAIGAGGTLVVAGVGSSITAYRSDTCYPDCNEDGAVTVQDLGCFQTQFVLGTAYADCNGDGVRTVQDFGCFQTKFVQGCP